MKIGAYSLKKILFQNEARSLTCATVSGEITVLDDHRPLISVLKKGIIKIIDKSGKEYYIPISSGFLMVHGGSEVKIIAEENTT